MQLHAGDQVRTGTPLRERDFKNFAAFRLSLSPASRPLSNQDPRDSRVVRGCAVASTQKATTVATSHPRTADWHQDAAVPRTAIAEGA